MATKRVALDLRPLRKRPGSVTAPEGEAKGRLEENPSKRTTTARELDAPHAADALNLEDALLRFDRVCWGREHATDSLHAAARGGTCQRTRTTDLSGVSESSAAACRGRLGAGAGECARRSVLAQREKKHAPGAWGQRLTQSGGSGRACARARRCPPAQTAGPTCLRRRARTSTCLPGRNTVEQGEEEEHEREERAGATFSRGSIILGPDPASVHLDQITPPSGNRGLSEPATVATFGAVEKTSLLRRPPRSAPRCSSSLLWNLNSSASACPVLSSSCSQLSCAT